MVGITAVGISGAFVIAANRWSRSRCCLRRQAVGCLPVIFESACLTLAASQIMTDVVWIHALAVGIRFTFAVAGIINRLAVLGCLVLFKSAFVSCGCRAGVIIVYLLALIIGRATRVAGITWNAQRDETGVTTIIANKFAITIFCSDCRRILQLASAGTCFDFSLEFESFRTIEWRQGSG